MSGITRSAFRVPIAVVAAVLAVSTATSAQAAGAATEPPADSAAPSPQQTVEIVDPLAAEAMAKETGISVGQAKERLGKQRQRGELGTKLEKQLGKRTGGSYLDANGELVVTTTDAAGDREVKKGGGKAKRVARSQADLDALMSRLNEAAGTDAGSAQGWYVDVPNNQVVLTMTEGTEDAASKKLVKLAQEAGAAARVEQRPASQQPQTTAEYLNGGEEFVLPNGGTCSVGFNTLDSANRPVVLTAGHCVYQGGTMSRNGYWVGAARTANFPTDDFGTFWNSYPGYWVPRGAVNTYNGYATPVRGTWDAPIGATVCKSGRTTGWTCGTIVTKNKTVNYPGSGPVYQLVVHTACVEPGDSGGANISTGGYALGVTSGALLVDKRYCRARYGAQNESYYQPIGEALSRNGLRLVVS